MAAVDEAFSRLSEGGPGRRPAIGIPAGLRVERVLVRRFPYIVLFVENPRSIRVLAVSHARRRPGYWRARLRSSPRTSSGR